MEKLIELIKVSPETYGWIGFVIAFAFFAERVIGLYTKTSSERRARRKEDLESLSELVGNNTELEKLCVESKLHEAFSRLTKLDVCKERRDELLEILAMGFISHKRIRLLEPFITRTPEGKYVVTIGLAQLVMVVIGLSTLFFIGVVMMAINFSAGEHGNWVRLGALVGGGIFSLGTAFLTRGDAQSVFLALHASKRLEEKGLLDGESGFKALVKRAHRKGGREFSVMAVLAASILLFGWLWAASLKG